MVLEALIWIGAPVFGLRPIRAARNQMAERLPVPSRLLRVVTRLQFYRG